MNEEPIGNEDGRLIQLLRESRAMPSLPPRFAEGVWRRIERGEIAEGSRSSWLERLVARVLRPRLAMAVGVVLVLAGGFLGVRDGSETVRQHALVQYLTAVAPNPIR